MELKDGKTILLTYAHERMMRMGLKPHLRSKTPEVFLPEYFGDFPRSENDLIRLLGRKWKNALELIGSFYDEYKYITSNYLKSPILKSASNNPSHASSKPESSLILPPLVNTFDKEGRTNRITLQSSYDFKREVPILRLSTTSANLLDLFGSSMAISRLLKKLLAIKGIALVDASYRFDKGKGHSRTYAYNKEIEKIVLATVRKHNIPLLAKKCVMTVPKTISPITDKDLFDAVKVSSKLHELKVKCDDDTCKQILWQKYAQLIAPRLAKIEAMNATLPTIEQIKFKWHIQQSPQGFLSKIGIRATSVLASFKKEETKHIFNATDRTSLDDDLAFLDAQAPLRRDYLDALFGEGEWTDYDVSGSIYQLSHLLNFGEWIGDKADPYSIMFGQNFNGNERKIYKSLAMSLYFDKTPASIVSHNKRYTPNAIETYGDEAIKAILAVAEKQMRQFTGQKFDSEIFLHESLLYTDFVWELRRLGIRTVQVYDGFYFKPNVLSKANVAELMEKCAMNYLADFRKWENNPIATPIDAPPMEANGTKRHQTHQKPHRKRSSVKDG